MFKVQSFWGFEIFRYEIRDSQKSHISYLIFYIAVIPIVPSVCSPPGPLTTMLLIIRFLPR